MLMHILSFTLCDFWPKWVKRLMQELRTAAGMLCRSCWQSQICAIRLALWWLWRILNWVPDERNIIVFFRLYFNGINKVIWEKKNIVLLISELWTCFVACANEGTGYIYLCNISYWWERKSCTKWLILSNIQYFDCWVAESVSFPTFVPCVAACVFRLET